MPRDNKKTGVRERISDMVDSTKEKFEDMEDSTVHYIKKNPLKSVAIALGVGALIGAGISMGIESAVRNRMRKKSFWEKYNPLNLF